MCYRCFWPKEQCWCPSIRPMATRTRFVFLMHPKEFKEEKAGTGRLTQLCLENSEKHMGVCFDEHPEVRALLEDPRWFPALLYPGGGDVRNLDAGGLHLEELGERRLLAILLDGTWSCARKMLRMSPSLQRLPRLSFTPRTAVSRFVIKQQPQIGCLSTLEATHELLLALERAGLDSYSDPQQMLGLFERMQAFQIACASDPARDGYRRSCYRTPVQREPRAAAGSGTGLRRRRYLPAAPAAPDASSSATLRG